MEATESMDKDREYRYNRLTWPEMNDAIARQKVVILPTGSTEQHGRHLPIDVDLFLAESICLEAGRRAEGGCWFCRRSPMGSTCTTSTSPARSTSSRKSSSPSA